MSQENLELVQQASDAFNRRDVDGVLKSADRAVVWDWSRAVGPERGVFCGRDEVVKFVRSWWEAFDESIITIDELIDAGDHVVSVFHGRQRGRSSGVEVEGPGSVLVWSFRDGRLRSTTLYQNRADALAAVGLSE